MNSQKLMDLSDRIAREIATLDRNLLSSFPIAKYLECIEKYPKISNYGYINQELKDFCRSIVYRSSERALELYHQLILVNLILIGKEKIEKNQLPEDIKKLCNSNFDRVAREIESGGNTECYNYGHDKFRKNMAICSLRLIPAGAQKINLSGISRRFLFRKGFTQFMEGIIFGLFELGGFYPLYEMHTDSNDPELMADFNEDGWIKFYGRVYELLKTQPDVKGVFGSSWFFDPKLEKISPRLLYLRKIVTDNGGKLFYLGSNSQTIRDATLKSTTRRKLYEENKYMPTSYLLVWPRKKLISWVESKSE
jgi:hypothetical protein